MAAISVTTHSGSSGSSLRLVFLVVLHYHSHACWPRVPMVQITYCSQHGSWDSLWEQLNPLTFGINTKNQWVS